MEDISNFAAEIKHEADWWFLRYCAFWYYRQYATVGRETEVDEVLLNEKGKKVALVIGQLSYGGAEKQTVLLAEGLLHAGKFAPIVFCLSQSIEPYGPLLRSAGVDLYIVDRRKSKIAKLAWLVDSLHQAHCDLLYGVMNVGNIYAGAASVILRLPLVTSIRSANENIPVTMRTLSRCFINHSAYTVANSQSCMASLRKVFDIQRQPVRLIRNAIIPPMRSAEAKTRLRSIFGIPTEATVIGTVALLKHEKRPEFFIRVCQELYNSELNTLSFPYHFLWIGDGPESTRVTSLLTNLPVGLREKIHFVGARSDIADCLAAMDVFVLTSAYEGMPNALLEAMAAGLPCIATNVPGTSDVFTDAPHGQEIGVLASADDPTAFASQLREMILDPHRLQLMGESAQLHIKKNYALETMIQDYQETFGNVLARTQSYKGGV